MFPEDLSHDSPSCEYALPYFSTVLSCNLLLITVQKESKEIQECPVKA
jgi:hypothetical protein